MATVGVGKTPADPDTWAKNAATSLVSLMNTHSADGIDLNIENTGSSTTGWQGFAEVMCDVISRLHAAKPQTIVSIAPFEWIDDESYVPLWKRCGDKVDFINYQSYAARNTEAAKNLLLGKVVDKYALKVRRQAWPGPAKAACLHTAGQGLGSRSFLIPSPCSCRWM